MHAWVGVELARDSLQPRSFDSPSLALLRVPCVSASSTPSSHGHTTCGVSEPDLHQGASSGGGWAATRRLRVYRVDAAL